MKVLFSLYRAQIGSSAIAFGDGGRATIWAEVSLTSDNKPHGIAKVHADDLREKVDGTQDTHFEIRSRISHKGQLARRSTRISQLIERARRKVKRGRA